MTPLDRSDWISRRIRLAVGQRLLLGLAPALLAVLLVLALSYYGELDRQAPEYVVGGAGVLAILSLVMTWWNTRYLVGRLRRLGRGADDGADTRPPVDDLDRIEGEVDRLATALTRARRDLTSDHERLETRLHEQGTLLAATLRGVTAQVDEVRLPLHILLEARFGELNENQEELLVSAREAADAIDAAVRRLAIVADADRDALSLPLEPVSLNDVVRAILPMVRATADRRGLRVDTQLEPGLPRVWANRAALAESMAMITARAAERMDQRQPLAIATTFDDQSCTIDVTPVDGTLASDPLVMTAARALNAQQATLTPVDGVIRVRLPRALAAPRIA
jgi:signal transduction histidine kinase